MRAPSGTQRCDPRLPNGPPRRPPADRRGVTRLAKTRCGVTMPSSTMDPCDPLFLPSCDECHEPAHPASPGNAEVLTRAPETGHRGDDRRQSAQYAMQRASESTCDRTSGYSPSFRDGTCFAKPVGWRCEMGCSPRTARNVSHAQGIVTHSGPQVLKQPDNAASRNGSLSPDPIDPPTLHQLLTHVRSSGMDVSPRFLQPYVLSLTAR